MAFDLNSLKDKAEGLIEEHEDKVTGAVDKVAGVVAGKTGRDEQVGQGAEKLKGIIGDVAEKRRVTNPT